MTAAEVTPRGRAPEVAMKLVWIAGFAVILAAAIAESIPWVITIAWALAAAPAVWFLLRPANALAGGWFAPAALWVAIAIGFFGPLVWPVAMLGFVAWTWYSVTPH